MMNQSEIDAGPPNKKPKIGGSSTNVGASGSVVISSSSTGVNGLASQISETNGEWSALYK